MNLTSNNATSVNGLVLSSLTRMLLIADAAGCVQLETNDTILIKVVSPDQETCAYPQDLQAALELARSEGASWLTISNIEGNHIPDNVTLH